MAPSPENDTAPKAPDKLRHEKCTNMKEKSKDDKTLSDLNDGELKGLLDEALNYKNPKDREGKSKLFNHLLNEAEEDERNARAARAGGSELVRYCNPSAKRNSRHRKKPSSISENMMHGGSLDNLANDELYETSKHRTKKSVSARQREGGSLPCNVNASTIITHDYQFLEEARKKKELTEKLVNDVVEEQRLLEHDTLDQNFQEKGNEILATMKFTTRASLQVNEVDSPVQFAHLEQGIERKTSAPLKSGAPNLGADCSIRISNDTKKVDENGNLHQNPSKPKKKKTTDKNVVVCNAENVEGHRSDIISDINKLMEFIGTEEKSEKNRLKSKLNRHSSDDKSKKRAHSSKNKDGGRSTTKLKKSNSLSEISTTNLEEFEVVMRNGKNNVEKSRERRSWGNVDPLPLQNLYANASAENLETAEFRVVTKKKKSKKRRSSIGGGRTKVSSNPIGKNENESKDIRRKSACSVPHSEKSNDSSDVDSVHSLPIDSVTTTTTRHLNMPISYADMAKINDKTGGGSGSVNNNINKEKKIIIGCDKLSSDGNSNMLVNNINNNNLSGVENDSTVKNTPPDVHNFKNFPAITKQVYSSNNVICGGDKIKNSNKCNRNNKNIKNNVNKMMIYGGNSGPTMMRSDVVSLAPVEDSSSCSSAAVSTSVVEMGYSSSLPPDIPDVQTIDKMQLMCQGHPSNCYDTIIPVKNGNDCTLDCDISENRTTNNINKNNNNNNNNIVVDNRPPVVILSGYGNNKEVPGLVFGFDINEQLLSEDNISSDKEFQCEEFIARYMAPEVYTATSHNHDKIVSFIGAAWEEALGNLPNGKVQFYSDLL